MVKRAEKTKPPEPTVFIDSYLTERESSEREVDKIAFNFLVYFWLILPFVAFSFAIWYVYVYAPNQGFRF